MTDKLISVFFLFLFSFSLKGVWGRRRMIPILPCMSDRIS